MKNIIYKNTGELRLTKLYMLRIVLLPRQLPWRIQSPQMTWTLCYTPP